uniref:Uncharacterized protein n=1 Tax=Anguilla anguilla TaxID=7936 RepID=A0A0E9WLM4_ANGAN
MLFLGCFSFSWSRSPRGGGSFSGCGTVPPSRVLNSVFLKQTPDVSLKALYTCGDAESFSP